MLDRKQMELDAFEKSILELAFGNNYQSNPSFMWVSKFFPGILQKRIDSFEQFISPFMDSDGKVDGAMLKSLANGRLGSLKTIIPDQPFYLSDVSATLKMVFLGENK